MRPWLLGFLAASGTVGGVIGLLVLGWWAFTTYPNLVELMPWIISGFYVLFVLVILTAVFARTFERRGL